MNLPNRSVARLIEIIRAWPDLKRMLYDYLGRVIADGQEDGGPTGDIAPQFTTDLYYANDPIPLSEWVVPVAGAPPWPASSTNDTSGMKFYQFDKTNDEEIRFWWSAPEGFDPSINELTLRLFSCANATTASKDVVVTVGAEVYEDGDDLSTVSFTTTQTTLTMGTIDLLQIDEVTLSSGLDELQEGELVFWRVRRDGSDGSDNLDDDWNLYHIQVRYRCNSVGRYP